LLRNWGLVSARAGTRPAHAIVLLAGVEDSEHVVAFDALRILLKLFLDLSFGFFDAALAEKLLRFSKRRSMAAAGREAFFLTGACCPKEPLA